MSDEAAAEATTHVRAEALSTMSTDHTHPHCHASRGTHGTWRWGTGTSLKRCLARVRSDRTPVLRSQSVAGRVTLTGLTGPRVDAYHPRVSMRTREKSLWRRVGALGLDVLLSIEMLFLPDHPFTPHTALALLSFS